MRNAATKMLLAVVCLAICLSGCSGSGPKVSVTSVSEILGIGPIGMVNRYAGIVEAGETVSVNKDATLEVAEIAVSAGDAVTKGQVLFTYETASLSIEVERMQLEIEQMKNTITTKKSQITTLEKERKTAAEANKLQYTLQIQQLQLDVKETEHNVTAKQKEIDRAKAKLADANVLSPEDGHIKEINASGATNPQTGEPLPFITITQEGEFRVRGTVNELNAQNFSVDMPVTIRSRSDAARTWTGTVTAVDWENPVQDNNMMMYGGPSDEMTTSSKYPFYVKLDSDLGLMLGQHVYIEPGSGQEPSEDGSMGFYLPAYYVNVGESDPWVWAVNSKDRLEKRTVVLGNYDIETDSYEIMEGLGLDDFIAYPDDNCKAGAKVRYPGEALPEDEDGYDENAFGDVGDLGQSGDFDGQQGEDFAFDDAGSTDAEGISGGIDDAAVMPDPGEAAVQGTEAVG